MALSHSPIHLRDPLGQVFYITPRHKAHPSLQSALQPAGVVELTVRQPACRLNLCDNVTRLKGETSLIPTHPGPHGPPRSGLSLLPLLYGHHFPSPSFNHLKKVLLLLLGLLLGLLLLFNVANVTINVANNVIATIFTMFLLLLPV